MTTQPPQVNLISVLPEIFKSHLVPDVYSNLEYVFGLTGAVAPGQLFERIENELKLKRSQDKFSKLFASLKRDIESDHPEIYTELIELKNILLGIDNFSDSFNTENKLIALVQARYDLKSLKNNEVGIAVIIFCLLGFGRFHIRNCQAIWKLTNSKYDEKYLEILDKSVWEVLIRDPKPIEFIVLSDRCAIHKKTPDDASLHFVLLIDPRVEILERDFVQAKFSALNASPMIYRVLFENKRQMSATQIQEEINNRLNLSNPFGAKTPQVKNFLSLNADRWYAQGNDGWGLLEWGTKKDELPDLLKGWFRETKIPATRKQMVDYLQPLRPDLASIAYILLNLKEIVKVEYLQSDLNPGGREELYYHKSLLPQEGIKQLRSNKSTSSTSKIPKKSNLPKLFISYAHAGEGKKFLDEFRMHLSSYENNNLLNVWDDTDIVLGEKWDKSIKSALTKADAALFLVTPQFVISEYINSIELKKILERAEKNQVKIYWVHVERCIYTQSPLYGLQSAYDPSKPLNEFVTYAERNKAIVEISERIFEDLSKFS
jgi:hypothetical protein